MHEHIHLIVAPTGTGKSTVCKQFPTWLVDGDKVIFDTIGWPKGHRWWEKMSEEDHRAVRSANAAQVILHALGHLDKTVLFNDGGAATLAGAGLTIVAWILSDGEYVQRAASRRQLGVTSQPNDADVLIRCAQRARKNAERYNWRVFSRFSEILARFGPPPERTF